ncbi:leucine-rich repeat-containing protein 56 isoform X1 [Crotalus tigris]|uniref:leucine-rich repeat-containing protein 56 isoform X1 n=2 Tax=Crotalus tigris TaxID=88082 RepID=UPI00192F3A0D|nr:leucine-rich repeat-containing protein 56 isoform X1 [Crotalus tigris]XP_039187162.1 leucine-rich repeat-containing protein 56 isoform X1 [Crotalus tigris]
MVDGMTRHSEMKLNWKLDRSSRPGSAAVRVTDLGWQGLLNPNPSVKEDEELLVDEYLSPYKLKALTGLDDLRQVKALEMHVNTRENSLGNFGSYLPNLKQLKLNGSVLTSVRDLGTALPRLQVLWMARCGLPDLDGISACCSLKELYIAYNNIGDLSQISLLENLEILDLEGNNIEDLSQIQYLRLCTKLTNLTIEGNLICLKPSPQSSEDPDYNYRIEVKKLIPHLKFLDEIPANQTAIPFPCKMNKDWFIVKESIKEGNLIEEASGSDSQLGFLTRRLGSALRPAATHFLLGSRPQALQRSPSAHLLSGCSTLLESTIYDEILPDDDSSDLTHGVSRVICGNPIKALHARRQKLGSTVTNLFQPPCHLAEHNYDFEETGSVNEKDIFAELKVLQEHHYQHLQALQRAKSPQLLKISHSDEEGEEEEKGCSLSDSFDEDFKEAFQDITQMISSEASCCPHLSQMSSDSSHSLANALPSIVKRSLQPSPPKCPSPASMGVTAGLVRTRHLKIPHSKKAVLKLQPPLVVNRDEVQHMAERTAALNLHRKPDSSSNTAVFTQRQTSCGSKQIRRPFSGPAAFGPTNRATVDRSLPKTISHQIPVTHSYTNMPERFAVLNMVHPLTAKAALQSLSKRPDISMMAQSKTPQL